MKALVTGGGGFLGKAIVKMLVERGDEVVTFQRGRYEELDELGVKSFQGDLTGNTDCLSQAAEGCDIVFHTAAKAGVWGSHLDYININFIGTRTVYLVCKSKNIQNLVYTSSPSVVFSGRHEDGIDESAPYPANYLTAYPATKAEGEKLILAVNNQENLATVALRPHLIWGPGDPHLVKRILERGKAGRLRLVGDGSNLVDTTYIDNAAAAHIAAGDCLMAQGPHAPCAGKAYFISNGEPLSMADIINRILAAGGQPPVAKTISPKAAYAIGWAMEKWYKLLGIQSEPLMTRFVARQLACSHWYDISAARRDFGYEPKVSIDEGMQLLAQSLKEGSCDEG